EAVGDLDVNANELALVYRARGMSEDEARNKADETLATHNPNRAPVRLGGQNLEEIGSPWQAALSSFCFFASGAVIPVIPYLFGMAGPPAIFLAAGLVGLAL